ncbi:MAG: polyribonucleotide nucleotidyltransferase [Actinobacteria bacterium]|nr:polyribonucleotide nucleotidyltransferase [Actinomycetota bacterium]MBL7060322.1 polyribonucleotide nucleotidyltransferase [Actinomycetota bacterium]
MSILENSREQCEINIDDKTINFSTGKLAKQANGSVLAKSGGNGIIITTVMSETPRENIDFFPLIVDVEERMYAAGKIPGGFFKREGRATDKAILISRLTDRPLRPLFDKNLRNEVQIVATVISVDQINPYDILIVNGASTALYISDIPFNEPIGAVRIAKIDKEWIVNPTYEEINKSIIDIVVAGTENAILMVEAKGKEAGEEIIIEAIERAQPEIRKIISVQKEFREKIGIERRVGCKFESDKNIALKVKKLAEDKIKNKLERVAEYAESEERKQLLNSTKKGYLQDELKIIENEVLEALKSDYPENSEDIKTSLKEIERNLVREMIINKKIRPDGRKPDEIRKITCEVGLFPETTHGTGLFTRGRTQALTILALGSVRESQRIDSLGTEEFKRFMHHYNFPPYSTGETWPLRGPKRREIGHGALAEKALKPMIPDEEKFPYSLRLVSEILESNGSTSMASVCGCTLALMDAGVPIANPVSGIAMGLVKGENNDFVVLSDIQGMEDFYGDMDFKVAGTKNGITALQMDIKIKGINIDIIRKALERAREGRLYILQKILDTIPEPRKSLSKIVPKIITFKIPRDKIGEVIGPGGKNIKGIKEEFELEEINVDDSNGEGVVSIVSCDDNNTEMAKKKIKTMIMGIEGLKEGEEFLGTVVGITNYGAFVNLIPGLDGLLHISKISDRRIDKVEDVLKIGDKIDVKIDKIDKRDKKVSLKRIRY